MEEQTPNINVVHSVWRRLKKAKIRDLQPTKDVKGGGGVTGTSKPITGGTGTAGKKVAVRNLTSVAAVIAPALPESSVRHGHEESDLNLRSQS